MQSDSTFWPYLIKLIITDSSMTMMFLKTTAFFMIAWVLLSLILLSICICYKFILTDLQLNLPNLEEDFNTCKAFLCPFDCTLTVQPLQKVFCLICDNFSQRFSLWNFSLGKPRYVSIPTWSRSSEKHYAKKLKANL